MKRRDFMVSGTLAFMGASFSASVLANAFEKLNSQLSVHPIVADGLRQLQAILSTPDHARAIGRSFLASKYAMPSIGALIEGSGLMQRSAMEPIQQFVRNRSRDDFSQGKTVIVNGWVLSTSEACTYALLALHERG